MQFVSQHTCNKQDSTLTKHTCPQIVMDWLGKLLGLPHQFLSRSSEGSLGPGGGVIQGTASEAALVCMLAARARAMQGRPPADMAKLVAYTSDQVLHNKLPFCVVNQGQTYHCHTARLGVISASVLRL